MKKFKVIDSNRKEICTALFSVLGGNTLRHEFHFKAFISYSHRDKKLGEWLHKRLETYKLPRNLVGKETPLGPVPERLGRIFRDRDELPASDDLTSEVRKALEQSEFMIVLCSPNAASSRWVNREIIDFKRARGDKFVLPIIIDGEPFASDNGNVEDECFPPALRFKIGKDGMLSSRRAEPIAADVRKVADGEKRAFLKLVAGLAGVGLDEIIERDLRRKYKIVTGVTALSVLAVIVMSALTYGAVVARKEAEKQRILADNARSHAEFQRGEAEGLIEFMLTELRDKLKSVGRLDALGVVGERAVGYYDGQILENMPDASVGRSARAFHMLAEVQNTLGNSEEALQMFERAARATGAALERDPDNFDRLFEHSQSVYYVGYVHWQRGEYEKTEPLWRDYEKYARKMVELEPDNLIGHTELGYASGNVGTLMLQNFNDPNSALKSFMQSLKAFKLVASSNQGDSHSLLNVADKHAWIADCLKLIGDLNLGLKERMSQIIILDELKSKFPEDKSILSKWSVAKSELAAYGIFLDFNSTLETQRIAYNVANDLIGFDPNNRRWKENYAKRAINMANSYLFEDKIFEAKSTLSRAKAIIEPIANSGANSVKYYDRIAWDIDVELSYIAIAEHDYTLAEALASRTIKLIEKRGAVADLNTAEYNTLFKGHYYYYLLLEKQKKNTEALRYINYVLEQPIPEKLLLPDILLLKFRMLERLGQNQQATILKKKLIDRGVASQHFI